MLLCENVTVEYTQEAMQYRNRKEKTSVVPGRLIISLLRDQCPSLRQAFAIDSCTVDLNDLQPTVDSNLYLLTRAVFYAAEGVL